MSDESEKDSDAVISEIVPANIIAIAANELTQFTPDSVDVWDFHKSVGKYESSAENGKKAAYKLIDIICSYHFVPNDSNSPFQPLAQMEGRRSAIPSDMSSEQVTELASAVPSIVNSGLRARVADTAWTMKRSEPSLGFAAIDAYCEVIETTESGKAKFAFDCETPLGVRGIDVLTRICRIMRMMGWKRAEFDRAKAMISRLIDVDSEMQDLLRISTLALDWGFGDPADIGAKLISIAENAVSAGNHDFRARIYEISARAFHISKDEENKNLALIAKAECKIKQAKTAPSSIVKAAFLKDAIEQFIAIPNMLERRKELETELRFAQSSVRDEMSIYEQKIDLSEIVKSSLEVVHGETFPRALFQLFMCDILESSEKLREDVFNKRRNAPLATLLAPSVYDRDGRVVFQAESENFPDLSENQIKFHISQHLNMGRQLAVQGAINPIRSLIQNSFPFKENMLINILASSPLIPENQVYIFSRGADAFLHGDDIQAAHLLVPQLENSIRHVLYLRGFDTTFTRQNGLQEVASLSVMLGKHRDKLVEVFGETYVHEIDMLFDFPGGPRVRNDLAHGLKQSGDFFSHSIVYANWFILQLVLCPLFDKWSDFEKTFALQTGLFARDADET